VESARSQAIVESYKTNGRGPTLHDFKGLTDSHLYAVLHKAGVRLRGQRRVSRAARNKRRRELYRKALGKANARTRRGGKGPQRPQGRAPYKPRRQASNGGAADALVYLGKARERLIASVEGAQITDCAAALGLVALAIEALGGE
jgi:hypothetical protein